MVNVFFSFVMLRKFADGFGGVEFSRSAPVYI